MYVYKCVVVHATMHMCMYVWIAVRWIENKQLQLSYKHHNSNERDNEDKDDYSGVYVWINKNYNRTRK